MTTMLIIDDSMMTRLMVKTIVSEANPDWEIIQASDGDDALKKLVDKTFDYATVDMNMPGMTGLELIPYLQKHCPDAKIALLTANIQSSIQDKATSLGVPVINKPVSEDKILGFIGG